jgi:hypothetical protein
VSTLTTPTTSHPRPTARATPAPTSRAAVDLPTLRRVTPRRLVSAAHDLATDRDRWSHLVACSPDERLAVRLGATGAFVVVEGTLEDATLAPPRRHQPAALVHRTLAAGRARSFGPHHVHEVACRGSAPAVSLHLYGPALASMRRYVLDEDGRAAIVARERAGVDW